MSKKEKEPEYLPTMAPERDPEIHRAGKALVAAIEELGTARGKKNDKEAKLIEIMENKNVQFYQFGDLKIQIKNKKSAVTKNIDADTTEGEGEESEDGKE